MTTQAEVNEVTQMDGYDENSYHKGFEEGHSVGFQEGMKRGQILAVSELLNFAQTAFIELTKDLEE